MKETVAYTRLLKALETLPDDERKTIEKLLSGIDNHVPPEGEEPLLNGQKPTMYIGKKPFYIRFIGVDRETGETVTPASEKPSPAVDRFDRFARVFGYARTEKEPAV